MGKLQRGHAGILSQDAHAKMADGKAEDDGHDKKAIVQHEDHHEKVSEEHLAAVHQGQDGLPGPRASSPAGPRSSSMSSSTCTFKRHGLRFSHAGLHMASLVDDVARAGVDGVLLGRGMAVKLKLLSEIGKIFVEDGYDKQQDHGGPKGPRCRRCPPGKEDVRNGRVPLYICASHWR